jgi:hypothetical protein
VLFFFDECVNSLVDDVHCALECEVICHVRNLMQ